MKIATYNVNGINGRLAVLLHWLELAEPDVICLQELKAPDASFPEAAIRDLGYDAIWHGQKSWNGVAILSRVGEIQETRRGLPGDADDDQSRYIEAAVNGVLIAGLYLPNGNPRPVPKFDYKLRWRWRFDRWLRQANGIALEPIDRRPAEGDVLDGGNPYSLLCSRHARGQVVIHRTQKERSPVPRSALPAKSRARLDE